MKQAQAYPIPDKKQLIAPLQGRYWLPNLVGHFLKLEQWQEDYNTHRPHSALGNLTPREFAEKRMMDKLAA
ncbi:integrase core domain-containing protein [uncultured Shimia sp.]|uniref:integrase core domain-containing protein n=1 Tax=uncultured Shimia sp. TaxID=573152 RepID=UPI00261EA6B1|nr:integrase core domain-containing protein [uncultured Shimia sp.]